MSVISLSRLGLALAASTAFLADAPASAQAPPFSGFVVFGDSLSDTGNVASITQSRVGVRYPSQTPFNYADGRFTNNRSTSPPSARWSGVWHEQLATFFTSTALATDSRDNATGTCFAFGGATTRDGQQDRTVVNNPTPWGGGQYTIPIDNMGKQVTDFLARGTPDANALYLIWGGGNDLFDDYTDTNVTATANRMGAFVIRLAQAGARSFLVPNLPPLGNVPHYNNGNAAAAPLNAASATYRDRLNAALDAAVATLAGQGITVRVYRLDIYTLFQNLVASPLYFGFTNTQGSAQGNNVAADQFVFWDDLHPTAAGHYQIAAAAARVLAGKQVTTATLGNISARAQVGTGDDVTIGGFVVTGTSTKRVLLRGLGPSLSQAGVNGTMQNPSLTLYNSQGAVIGGNDDWPLSSQRDEIIATGLAPTGANEAALIATLNPGAYTVLLSGVGGDTGVGLVEAYDLDTATTGIARAINLSTRARIAAGDGVLIGGFVVAGTQSKRVVVRALGPDLAGRVPSPLADPTLTVYNAQGQAIATNDNWQTDATSAAAIQAAGLAPGDIRDSAVILTLPAGAYTAVVRGAGGATGTAIVEIYDLD